MKYRKITILVVCFISLCCIFLYGVTFYKYSSVLPSGSALEKPNLLHILGTDDLGVDIFAQISRSFFHSMFIGLSCAFITFILGGVLGISAGFVGGKVDILISFFINIALSIPQLPVMIVLGAFLGQRTSNVILIISAFSWGSIAKIMRAKTISICDKPFIKLAKSYGGTNFYIIYNHLLRQLLPLLSVNAIAVIGSAIIQESSLAYLGLSDPLARSWGLMISKATRFNGIFFTEFWKWWLMSPLVSLVICTVLLRLLSKELQQILQN